MQMVLIPGQSCFPGSQPISLVVKYLKPIQLGAAVFRHLGPGVGAADEGANSNHEDIMEQVPGVATRRGSLRQSRCLWKGEQAKGGTV
jgi:hypothetical protein